MRRSPAEILASIRPQVLDKLVETRGTMDHVYHKMDGDELRSVFDVLLGKIQSYLSEGDPRAFKAYVRRWVAMRVAAGARHENLIPAIVAVGDTAIEVGRDTEGDTDETRALMVVLARTNLAAARVVVDVLADEYRRRGAQLSEQSAPDAETRI